MATIYKLELVSHWINYTEEELEKILNEMIQKNEKEKGNEIQIKVLDRS